MSESTEEILSSRPKRKKNSPEREAWRNMRKRCYDPKNRRYKYYGGRGIRVCRRWMKFENFFADMGLRPSDQFSLDRKKTNGHYCKSNCRWATHLEQQNNRRDNVRIEFGGENLTLAEWARKLGGHPGMVWTRIHVNKWSVEKALTTPVDVKMRKNVCRRASRMDYPR